MPRYHLFLTADDVPTGPVWNRYFAYVRDLTWHPWWTPINRAPEHLLGLTLTASPSGDFLERPLQYPGSIEVNSAQVRLHPDDHTRLLDLRAQTRETDLTLTFTWEVL
jgi:hypothetical protein